jgi:ubiquinone/menaquinone biosynthesis C-methylase UbiE
LAEGEGFEPPVTYRPLRFSRPLPSSTRPSLQRCREYTTAPIKCQSRADCRRVPGRVCDMRRLASLWKRILASGFCLLYGRFARSYDAVARIVSLGQWHLWSETGLDYVVGHTVLEVGHGPGHLLPELHRRGYRAIGLDPSPQMGVLARNRLRARGMQLPVIRGRAQHLPFLSSSFDTVIATFPTDFIFDPLTLSEVARVLAPGGSLVAVLSAVLVRSDPISRIIEWAYRITGQREPRSQTQIAPAFLRAGLIASQLEVEKQKSHVTVLVARHLTPNDRI